MSIVANQPIVEDLVDVDDLVNAMGSLALIDTVEEEEEMDAAAAVEEEEDSCPICYENMSVEKTKTIHGCGHKFCGDCINVLNKKISYDSEGLGIKVIDSCPMCRSRETVSTDKLKLRVKELISQKNLKEFELVDLRRKCKLFEKTMGDVNKLFKKCKGSAAATTVRGGGGAAAMMWGGGGAVAANVPVPVFLTADAVAADRRRRDSQEIREFNLIEREIRRRNRLQSAAERRVAIEQRRLENLQRNQEIQQRRIARQSLLGRCCVEGCSSKNRTRGKCAGNCGKFCCGRCKKCVECRA